MLSFWLCLWKGCFLPVCPCRFTHTHRQEMSDQLLQISRSLMMCNFCALGACRQSARFGFIPGLATNPFMPCWPWAMVKPESGGSRTPRPGRAGLCVGRWRHFPALQGPGGSLRQGKRACQENRSNFYHFCFSCQSPRLASHTFHLPFNPIFSSPLLFFHLVIYFLRDGKEIKEVAKRQQTACSSQSSLPGSHPNCAGHPTPQGGWTLKERAHRAPVSSLGCSLNDQGPHLLKEMGAAWPQHWAVL